MSGSGTNHYNEKFNPKSWVVNLRRGELVVEQSYFIPTYTDGHHETKAAAIMHAMTNYIDEAEKLKGYIDTLSTMLTEEMASEEVPGA